MKKTKSATTGVKGEQKISKETIETVLQYLQVEGDYETVFNEDLIEIILDAKDSGVIIGYHGENLEALQFILSLVVSKKIGRFIRVSVDVGDYKKNRSDFLQSLTMQTKERVLRENQEFSLPNLKSWERRIVHMLLQDDEEVISESVGEGRERTLVIKPRTKQSD